MGRRMVVVVIARDGGVTDGVSRAGRSHRAAWQPGNHEDGFLTGLDNLVRILEEAAGDVLCEDSSPWRSALKRRVLPEVLKDV